MFGDVEARPRRARGTTKDLVPANLFACPDCGDTLTTQTIAEAALIRHGGYGATRSTRRLFCLCGWALTIEVTEVRP